jgi:hypothetical protein
MRLVPALIAYSPDPLSPVQAFPLCTRGVCVGREYLVHERDVAIPERVIERRSSVYEQLVAEV